MKPTKTVAFIISFLLLCYGLDFSQTIRNPDDSRNIAPTVQPNLPTGIFTIYDGKTLRKGDFTFSRKTNPNIYTTNAEISDNRTKGAKVGESILPSKENLSRVYFVDDKNGWIIGNKPTKSENEITKSIYKTEDSGKNWKKVTLDIPANTILSDIFFLNASTGWIIFNHYSGMYEKDQKVSYLFKTIDGGKTWRIQLSQTSYYYGKVVFTDKKNGWMLGTNYGSSISRLSSVFRSNDGGEKWKDTAEPIRKQNPFTDAKAEIVGLTVENSEEAICVTWNGKFFKTKEGGKTWQQYGITFDVLPDQTIPDNLIKTPNNHLSLARGTESDEGIYSYIANEEKDGKWTLRWLHNAFCLYDILYLSQNEILVSGISSKNVKDEKSDIYHTFKNAVIYYSPDGGETFSTLYQKEDISKINSLVKISENQLIAVGENGLILNIEIEKTSN